MAGDPRNVDLGETGEAFKGPPGISDQGEI